MNSIWIVRLFAAVWILLLYAAFNHITFDDTALRSGAAPRLFASGGKISYLYRSLRARRISVGAPIT